VLHSTVLSGGRYWLYALFWGHWFSLNWSRQMQSDFPSLLASHGIILLSLLHLLVWNGSSLHPNTCAQMLDLLWKLEPSQKQCVPSVGFRKACSRLLDVFYYIISFIINCN
jgi:hypothetical protein